MKVRIDDEENIWIYIEGRQDAYYNVTPYDFALCFTKDKFKELLKLTEEVQNERN